MEKLLEKEELLFVEDFLRTEETEQNIALAWNFGILVQKVFDYGILIRTHLYERCEGDALNSHGVLHLPREFFSYM